MTALESGLRRIVADLDESGAQWALVGGLAVSARTEPRTTRDVDAVVAAADDVSAERLVFALQRRGYEAVTLLEQGPTARLATVRLRAPGSGPAGVVVDLLFASSGIEPEIVVAAERLEIVPGLVVPVASVGDLIALKVLSRDDRNRPQDWDDLRGLIREATPEDLARARLAVRWIQARGFHRGRELEAALDKGIAEHRPGR